MTVDHCWLIHWDVVLRPTQHKIGHFGDVAQASLLAWYGKTKSNTIKAHIHQSKEMYYNTNHNRFTALFPGPPRWAGARREPVDFMVQGKINRGRHTDLVVRRWTCNSQVASSITGRGAVE